MARGGYRVGSGGKKKTILPGDTLEGGLKPRREIPPQYRQTPLEYMLMVMNDPTTDVARADRMAIAAAPYVHGRVSDFRIGKKEIAAEAAKTAGAGSEWGKDLQFEGAAN